MFGWASFSIIQTAGISSLAYVFSQSLNSLVELPVLLGDWKEVSLFGVFYPFDSLSIKLMAVALIISLSVVNTRSIISGAFLSKLISWLVLIGIGTVMFFGLTSEKSNV
jgi:APA family basic amino acid/polyamine antiporter